MQVNKNIMNLNNITPVNQKKLYGLDNNFKELVNLFDNNKLPNKILFSGSKGIGKSTMAYHLTNYIFSINEDSPYNIKNFTISDQNNSFNLVNKKLHPNFYLVDVIDGKDSIEISQIRKMINYSMKSSFGKSEKIILIDKSYYKNNLFIKKNISNYIEQYFMQLMKISTAKNKVSKIYNETIKNVYNAKKYNLDIESIFIHLKGKLFNG